MMKLTTEQIQPGMLVRCGSNMSMHKKNDILTVISKKQISDTIILTCNSENLPYKFITAPAEMFKCYDCEAHFETKFARWAKQKYGYNIFKNPQFLEHKILT